MDTFCVVNVAILQAFIKNSFTRVCYIKVIGWVIFTKRPYKQKVKLLANREKVKIVS